MVDQLHISDRIFQHILLRILKPTFKYVMNPNCHHLEGPTGVRNATQKIREVLQKEQPKYFIRADIKSFYKSIPHHKLIRDIKKYYDDPKLISMLQNQTHGASRIVLHPRTLRKAREQVKWMVADGVSHPLIKRYLIRWLCWWLRTSSIWNYNEVASLYIESYWDPAAANMAATLFQQDGSMLLRSPDFHRGCAAELALAA